VLIMRGLLSGRFDEHSTFVEDDRRSRILAPDRLPAMLDKVRQMKDINVPASAVEPVAHGD
jgi:hypothetical protein